MINPCVHDSRYESPQDSSAHARTRVCVCVCVCVCVTSTYMLIHKYVPRNELNLTKLPSRVILISKNKVVLNNLLFMIL